MAGCLVSNLEVRSQVLVQFSQASNPAGLITSSSTLVSTGTVVSTVSAPSATSGYQFEFWTFNGQPQRDQLGQAINPVSFTIALPVSAVAQYLSATADSNSNAVPDWFEMYYLGSLTNGATSDADGDSFTLSDEYLRDYNPNIRDTLVDGGVSQRGSSLTSYVTGGYVLYTELSSPASYVNNQLILPTNTVRLLPDVSTAGLAAGYRFAEWRTNGVRVADATGRALASLPILVNSTTTNATAVFLPANQDTVGDGVPDWFKFQFYGTTNVAATGDTDADGWTLLDEYLRDYNPDFADTVVDGGVSQRSSSQIFVDTRPYTYYWVVTVPSGLFSDFSQVPVGTTVQTTNAPSQLASLVFGHWSVDGVPQHDLQGASPRQINFLVISNTVATAYYYSLSADSNGNGLPDWWEDYYFGCATCADPSADNTGTGMNNLQKYLAGLDPRDSRSVLAITASRIAADGYELTFPSMSGKVYQIEYRANLLLTNTWQLLLDNVQGDGSDIQIVDPGATGLPMRFYRIRLKP